MNSNSVDQTLQRARGALTPSAKERAHVLELLGARFPELAASRVPALGSSSAFPQGRAPSAARNGASRSAVWPAIRAAGAGGVALGVGLVAAGFVAGYIARG